MYSFEIHVTLRKGLGMEKTHLKIQIDKAAQGSEEALNFLVNKYKPLIEAEVSRHISEGMTNQDVTDLRQEAEIAFRNAVCNYDDSLGGVEFGLFAKICIGNSLVSFLRAYNRRGKVVPIDDGMSGEDGFSDPLEKLIEEEEFLLLRKKIQSELSPFENRVWWMYVSGISAVRIAEMLEVEGGVKSVNNAIYRIRKKLRALISK